MQIKPRHKATRAEVIAEAHAAANRDEPLDTANVFEVGTPNHALFTSEYLSQLDVLEGSSSGEFADFEIVVIEAVA